MFLIFFYDNGSTFFKRLYFRKSSGVFENVTNCYKPKLKIYCIGFGIKVFEFNLKINFINCKPPLIFTKTLKKPKMPLVNIKNQIPQITSPKFIRRDLSNLQLINTPLIINNYNDLEVFKAESSNKSNI